MCSSRPPFTISVNCVKLIKENLPIYVPQLLLYIPMKSLRLSDNTGFTDSFYWSSYLDGEEMWLFGSS
jgi:hypothetical protein